MRTFTSLAMLAGLALALSGCTGATTAPKPTSTASAQLEQHELPAPDTLTNDIAKRAHVTVTNCGAVDGGWAASGIVVAGDDAASADYTVTVFFTTEQATVVNYATTTVSVEPGQKAEWKAELAMDIPKDTNLICVLRAVS